MTIFVLFCIYMKPLIRESFLMTSKKAINVVPNVPERIAKQTTLPERIYSIDETPFIREDGSLVLSDGQYEKAKKIMRDIFT